MPVASTETFHHYPPAAEALLQVLRRRIRTSDDGPLSLWLFSGKCHWSKGTVTYHPYAQGIAHSLWICLFKKGRTEC